MNQTQTAKIKLLHPEARIPYRASAGATGYDITGISAETEEKKIPIWINGLTPGEHIAEGSSVKIYKHTYHTGISIQPPEGFDVKILPRSSVHKGWAWLSNSVGLADNDYRGEYLLVYYSFSSTPPFKLGDRIGQIIFQRKEDIFFEEADTLDETERGSGGFGSTGR